MAATFEQIMADLKAGKRASVYVLQGEEPFFIDKITHYIEHHAIPEQDRGFNQVVMYGKEANVGAIMNNAKRFPMMADRQLVLVKEAQEISDFGQEKGQKMLMDYLKHPLTSTMLVLSWKGKMDARKAFTKEAAKSAVFFTSEKVKDYKVVEWLSAYARSEGFKMSQAAANLMAEHIGSDLSRIANELEKLQINLKEGEEITPSHVSRYVGISKDYNVFELQKALLDRNALKSQQIVNYFTANPKDNPLIPIIASLFNYFVKVFAGHLSPDKSEAGLARAIGINPYIAKDYVKAIKVWPPQKTMAIIHAIRQADARSKGVESGAMSEKQILQELVFQILH